MTSRARLSSALAIGALLSRPALERSGTPIGSLDTLIAALAVALGRTLVTIKVREFRRVTGLRVENWLVA